MSEAALRAVCLLAATLYACDAGAACLDPGTGVSGYKVPLSSEIRSADAIAIGRVLSERALQDDPTDPDGVTAHNLSIRVLTVLKGKLPNEIVVRNENTSSRYSISLGEQHVLFLTRDARGLWFVNSCGSSAPEHESGRLVQRIQAELQKSAAFAPL